MKVDEGRTAGSNFNRLDKGQKELEVKQYSDSEGRRRQDQRNAVIDAGKRMT